MHRAVRERLYGSDGSELRAEIEAAQTESRRIIREKVGPLKQLGSLASLYVPVGAAMGTMSLVAGGAETIKNCVESDWSGCRQGAIRTAQGAVCNRLKKGADVCDIAATATQAAVAWVLEEKEASDYALKLGQKAGDTTARRVACDRRSGARKAACEAFVDASNAAAKYFGNGDGDGSAAKAGKNLYKAAREWKASRN